MSDNDVAKKLERQNELLEAILIEIRGEGLQDTQSRQTTLTAATERTDARVLCPGCGYVVGPDDTECPDCGWQQE